MSFIPQGRAEWIAQLKLGVFVLSLFGSLSFLLAGWSTGLGVFHNPSYCWVASLFALLALAVASRSRRWVALTALIMSILVGIYGYHENAAWKERLKQVEQRKSARMLKTWEGECQSSLLTLPGVPQAPGQNTSRTC